MISSGMSTIRPILLLPLLAAAWAPSVDQLIGLTQARPCMALASSASSSKPLGVHAGPRACQLTTQPVCVGVSHSGTSPSMPSRTGAPGR